MLHNANKQCGKQDAWPHRRMYHAATVTGVIGTAAPYDANLQKNRAHNTKPVANICVVDHTCRHHRAGKHKLRKRNATSNVRAAVQAFTSEVGALAHKPTAHSRTPSFIGTHVRKNKAALVTADT